jgi:ubiquinone/menaquinone biosynthesis C-methylase UbiE
MSTVEEHYDQAAEREWQRLLTHRTEFAVTMKALREHLPPPPAKIADIGGGPGRYSISLASDGYTVTLIDLSKGSLDLAKKKAEEANVELTAFIHRDATALAGIEDATFDSVLLLGPLYHLQNRKERKAAILEARRVVKTGGLFFAAFVTRFAPFRHAASEEPEWVIKNFGYAFELLHTGKHVKAKAFPSAYFTHPDEIEPLMEECDIQKVMLMGCEGIVAGHERLVNNFEGEDWDKWVELNYRLGQDPSLYGASDHMLYVGKNSA